MLGLLEAEGDSHLSALERDVVEVVDLVKDYGAAAGRRALDGLDLTVEAGSFVSVMGPSGSGKSTLLHMIGGLDRPSSGVVRVAGRDLGAMREPELADYRGKVVGFVFQAFNLVPVLTTAENVALPLVMRRQRGPAVGQRVDRVLELTGLGELSARLPAELSGGQQQRVAIARALVAEPQLLLADEPTGNLDTATGAEILQVLKDAQAELENTVILVTHDPKVAAVGTRVVHLRDGKVVDSLDLTKGRQRRPVERIVTWLTED